MVPIRLKGKSLELVLSSLRSSKGTEFGAARMVKHLAQHPFTKTVNLNQAASVGNLSDQVHAKINPRIAKFGLYVACVRPPEPIKNKHNQITGQHLWAIFKTAANYPVYDSFDVELEALKAEYPELNGKGETQEWLETLTDIESVCRNES